MIRRLAALAACALAAACTTAPSHPQAFAFAVFGDTPYSEAEEAVYLSMLRRIDREPLAFVVHVGDFKGPGPCSDELYAKRKAQLDALAHAVIYTPGDNEWSDCRFRSMGAMDALERLARLRRVFFPDRLSLGRDRLETQLQDRCVAPWAPGCPCQPYPENRAWSRAGVRFVTLHYVGNDNNTGFDRASDEEARCRDAANRAWLAQAARASEPAATLGLVVMMQANPWFTRKAVFEPLLRELEEAALRLRKPVLLVHGDTHLQRVDHPFVDAMGIANPWLTRLETFGSPFVGWVRVRVDPGHPDLFTFEAKLHGAARGPLTP